MDVQAWTDWQPSDFCRSWSGGDEVAWAALVRECHECVCRTDFSRPGFCLVDCGVSCSSQRLRSCMVQLAAGLRDWEHARSGRELVCQGVTRFDQQESTRPHRDGGPAECLLVLGYEPSAVASELVLQDYSRCAFDLQLEPAEFLRWHNPMLAAECELLEPYATPVACLSHQRYQLLVVNNSQGLFALLSPRGQGVLHTASVPRPDPGASRVINSMLLAVDVAKTEDALSEADLQSFATDMPVRRRGYDRTNLADDA